jgi:hypothetical protein
LFTYGHIPPYQIDFNCMEYPTFWRKKITDGTPNTCRQKSEVVL